MSQAVTQSLHEEAVAHAHLAERSGELTWAHIHSEFTQDVDKVAATLATGVPLAWTLAREAEEAGTSFRFLTGVDTEEIRDQYKVLRQSIEIHGWRAMLEIRQSWYTVTHGVSTLKLVPSGAMTQGETVALFPVGTDGILGELQIGTVGRRPDGTFPSDAGALPLKRLAMLDAHDAYVEALRSEDVDVIVAAHAPKTAVTIRDYRNPESSLLDVVGGDALRDYFVGLFQRYRVRDVRLVNRAAEAWYVFAELHWIVEERGGVGRTLEFCTAEVAPVDETGRYWVRTGAGTDPVDV